MVKLGIGEPIPNWTAETKGERLKYSLNNEKDLLANVLAYKDDPLGFVMFIYPWGQKGTFLEGLTQPRAWQIEELERITAHIRKQEFAQANNLLLDIWRSAYSSGRGPGKSALLGMLSHWHMSTHLGSTSVITSNTETQMASRTFPEFARWFGIGINAHWFLIERLKISPAPWLADAVAAPPVEGGLGIDSKYWYVAGQTWSEENPDSFAGVHNPYGLFVGFDEASGIPSKVWDVTRGFFTESNPYRLWVATSQMRRRDGRFFELFNDAKMGTGWRTRTISTRGMPGIDQNEIKAQIAAYGEDSDFVAVEIDGRAPRSSADQFIPGAYVKLAQDNVLVPDYGEPLILGVDPAPRGRTAWRFRQGRNARDCAGPATYGTLTGHDNVQIAEKILELDYKYKPTAICIDFGMGTGVIDYLKRRRPAAPVHEVKFGNSPYDKSGEYGSHGAELWGKVKEWLPGALIEKDDGSKGTLSHQLTDRGWAWSGREDGKKIMESKDDLQRRGVMSPDDVDALACTFEVNPTRSDLRRARPGQSNVRIADGVESSYAGW